MVFSRCGTGPNKREIPGKESARATSAATIRTGLRDICAANVRRSFGGSLRVRPTKLPCQSRGQLPRYRRFLSCDFRFGALVEPDGQSVRFTVPPTTPKGTYILTFAAVNSAGTVQTGAIDVVLLNGWEPICTCTESTVAASVNTFGQLAYQLQDQGRPSRFPIMVLTETFKSKLLGERFSAAYCEEGSSARN